MDFEAEGLLEDLEGEEREARRRLLQRLHEDGVSLQELKGAVAEERLVLLPLERVLGGRLTVREIEQQSGLPTEVLLRMRRLQGLPEAGPDERVFAAEDVEAGRATRLFLEAGLGEEAILAITRVLGESMARLTDTVAAAFVEAFLAPGQTEEDLALRFAELAERLAPAFHPVLESAYGAHLRDAVRRGVLGREERQAGTRRASAQLTVCFADLVGFTRLGWQLDPQELGRVAGRLAELAADLACPPVRLVKTIGDAAMFVSPEAEPAVAVALQLLEAVEEAELPNLRAGLAAGAALQRGGDFYGHTVNLASRVTGYARAGSVLCTQEVRDGAGDAFSWSFTGRHRLRGVSAPVALHRARPAQEAPPGGG